MSNEIVKHAGLVLTDLQSMKEFASIAIKSKIIPPAYDTPEKVIVAISLAQELGIPPIAALMNIAVINGRPTLQGNLILGLINQSGRARKIAIKSEETQCTVTMSRNDYEFEHTETFSLKDAERAGLTNKDTWKKYQKVMLKWRAVALCARTVFPEVIAGLNTPEELASEHEVVEYDNEENMVVKPLIEAPKEAPVDEEIILKGINAALTIDQLLKFHNGFNELDKKKYSKYLSARREILQANLKHKDAILEKINAINNGLDAVSLEETILRDIETLVVPEDVKLFLRDFFFTTQGRYATEIKQA